jgi:hypothetical protein
VAATQLHSSGTNRTVTNYQLTSISGHRCQNITDSYGMTLELVAVFMISTSVFARYKWSRRSWQLANSAGFVRILDGNIRKMGVYFRDGGAHGLTLHRCRGSNVCSISGISFRCRFHYRLVLCEYNEYE